MVFLTGKQLEIKAGDICQIRGVGDNKAVDIRIGANIFADFFSFIITFVVS